MYVDYMMSKNDILEYLYMLIYFQVLISFLNIYPHYVKLSSIRYDIQLL
jgi:hypothetical protein